MSNCFRLVFLSFPTAVLTTLVSGRSCSKAIMATLNMERGGGRSEGGGYDEGGGRREEAVSAVEADEEGEVGVVHSDTRPEKYSVQSCSPGYTCIHYSLCRHRCIALTLPGSWGGGHQDK